MLSVFPCDMWLSHAMQSLGDRFEPVMSLFTWLGYPQAFMIAVAVVYWSIDRKLGLRLALFLPVVASLNSILKQAFHAPRPYWLDPEIKAIRVSNGFGMPSGHAQASTVWLYGALYLRNRWFWIISVVVVLMIGLSRVYLGVHFSSQVIAGWLIGTVLLLLFYCYEVRFLSWFLGRSFSVQLLLISGISVGILLLGALCVYLTKEWQMPSEWIENAADDLAGRNESILISRGMSAVAGNCGGFLGVALGALMAHRRGGLEVGGSGWMRFLRSLAGLILLAGLFLVFSWFGPDQEKEAMVVAWRFSGFLVLSFFVIFLYPVLFHKYSPAA